MMKKLFYALLMAFAVAISVVTSGLSSTASASGMFANLLSLNPGARQIAPDTVRLANGVVAKYTPASAKSICNPGWLCIFDQPWQEGNQLSFYSCGFVNIGSEYGWSDRINSWVNNQTPGTSSIFQNWNGARWESLYRSVAFEVEDIAGAVHWTDGIWVC